MHGRGVSSVSLPCAGADLMPNPRSHVSGSLASRTITHGVSSTARTDAPTAVGGRGSAGGVMNSPAFAARQLFDSRRSRTRLPTSAHARSRKLPLRIAGTAAVRDTFVRLPGLSARVRAGEPKRTSSRERRASRERKNPVMERPALRTPALRTIAATARVPPAGSDVADAATPAVLRSGFRDAACAADANTRSMHTAPTTPSLTARPYADALAE